MRFPTLVAIVFAAITLAPRAHADDLIVKASPHSVAKTIDRLSAIMNAKGVTVFARVDHAAGAKKVGAELRPTELLIFGNPKLGTPMMQSDQRIGIDLPLKALAWLDGNGKVWLAYSNPATVAGRYGIKDRDTIVKKMTSALNTFTDGAIKP